MNSTVSSSATKLEIRALLSLWLGAAILCAPALWNNFPLLYPDTGTYVHCGFQHTVSEIRPLAYGLFIRHVSLHASLWFVILAQALMVSWSVHAFCRAFLTRPTAIKPLLWITILTWMTGLGEITGMLMPDFLSSVLILCSAILLFQRDLRLWPAVVSSLFIWFAVSAHHSSAYIEFLILLILITVRLIRFFKTKRIEKTFQRIALVACLTLAGYFTIPFLHWTYSGDFYWSKAKNIFMTNRVNQMGMLIPFLKKYCPDHQYRLCESIDSIPYDLLWDVKSPMLTSGGFQANDAEYGRMLNDFFRDPYYVKKFLIKSAENGVMQFFSFEGLVLVEVSTGGYPYQVFTEEWPEMIPPLRRSLQYFDRWDEKMFQHLQRFLVYGSAIYLLSVFVFFRKKRFTSEEANLAGYILIALIANAFICAGLSMVDVRFQYRVIWLVPLIAFLHFHNHWPELINAARNRLRETPEEEN